MHTLFDVEAGVPTFAYITEAKVHDVKAMGAIPYEAGSYYIFDRGYNDYKRLHAIHTICATFVVRAKKNVKYKRVSWKRKLQPNVLSDSVIHFKGHNQQESYPETFALYVIGMRRTNENLSS